MYVLIERYSMLTAKGKVWKASRHGGHAIYISSDIVKDSAYPFKPKDDVIVELDPVSQRLIIKKREQ